MDQHPDVKVCIGREGDHQTVMEHEHTPMNFFTLLWSCDLFLQGAVMTLDEAQENLRTLQHEVVVASLSHHQLMMGEAAREGNYYPEGGASSSCAKGGSDADIPWTAGSGVCSASGRVLLSLLHQHGQIAPWEAADEVCMGMCMGMCMEMCMGTCMGMCMDSGR